MDLANGRVGVAADRERRHMQYPVPCLVVGIGAPCPPPDEPILNLIWEPVGQQGRHGTTLETKTKSVKSPPVIPRQTNGPPQSWRAIALGWLAGAKWDDCRAAERVYYACREHGRNHRRAPSLTIAAGHR
jgi:hypothetical protein